MQELRQFQKFSSASHLVVPQNSPPSPAAFSRIRSPRLFAFRTRFHFHRRPQPQQIFRKITQTRAAQSFALRRLAKRRRHRRTLFKITPQLPFQLARRRMRIARPRRNPRHLVLPIPLLVRIVLQVIKHHLLGTVQAHRADTVRTPSRKTTAKPACPPERVIAFAAHSLTVARNHPTPPCGPNLRNNSPSSSFSC